MRSITHYPFHARGESVRERLHLTRTARRLMLIIAAVNLVGITCLAGAAHIAGGGTPVTPRAPVMNAAALLDSIGFTLMLPGVFFATIVFLCGRAFAWNDQTARSVWYACAFVINLIIACKIGAWVDNAPRA